MIDNIRIFDAHMHHKGRFKKRDESLIDYLDKYGIDKAAITTINQTASMNQINSLSNEDSTKISLYDNIDVKSQLDHEEILELTIKHPDRFIGFYWFNPKTASQDDWDELEQYIREHGFKGVKTQPCMNLLKIPDDYLDLAKFCIKFDIPLYIHASGGFFFQKPYRARDLYRLVKKFPDLKLIIGHAAHSMEFCINCIRYFTKTPNVYFETSTSVPYGIMSLIKSVGSERVIYGSDSPPATTPDIEINKIKILNLSLEEVQNIFYNNLNRLIGE